MAGEREGGGFSSVAAHPHQCLKGVNSAFQGLYMHGCTKTCTATQSLNTPASTLPPLPAALVRPLPLFNANGPRQPSAIPRKQECCADQQGGWRGVNPSSGEGPRGGDGGRGTRASDVAPHWIKL